MLVDALVWGLVALLGLLLGSFLNGVIHHLPRLLEAQWDAAAQEHAHQVDQAKGQAADLPNPSQNPSSGLWLGSPCHHCGSVRPGFQKIRVLGWLVGQGRCTHCPTAMGWREPAIELFTAGLSLWCVQHYGLNASALAWLGFAAALVALAAIDADTRLLPDAITQPLVWAGLLAASSGLSDIDLGTALWGAVAGYGVLWSVQALFKLATGQEGMGQGDFKLLAALGAWLGWPALLSLVLLASLSGIVGGLWLRLRQRMAEDGYIAFGPYLALAGLWVMVWGPWPDWAF